ncbi:MAG: hypothetical protein JW833_01655 [Prolixibacteraceae bacterium]|nr:hypothetical protein [Prolixibacteraceae bacterium]
MYLIGVIIRPLFYEIFIKNVFDPSSYPSSIGIPLGTMNREGRSDLNTGISPSFIKHKVILVGA